MKQTRRLRAVPKPAPIGGLMDKNFQYTRSDFTDIRKTFERVIKARKKGQFL